MSGGNQRGQKSSKKWVSEQLTSKKGQIKLLKEGNGALLASREEVPEMRVPDMSCFTALAYGK